MKNIIKRVAALIMVICTMMVMTIPAFAESNRSVTATSVAVDTSSGDYYVAHGRNIPVKLKASATSRTDYKFKQGSLVKIIGSEGSYYKVDMNGTVRYVKKDSVWNASDSFAGDIYYTTKDCPLRPVPYEGSTTATLPKGTAVIVVGTLTNSKGNTWFAVSYNDAIHYIYHKNVKKASKVTLELSGDGHTVDTLGELELKANVTPASIRNVEWSSSDTEVAVVDNSGVVTGVYAGDATITAKIDGIVSASWDVTVTRDVALDVQVYRQTTDYTCSAAAALAVLHYYGEALDVEDTTLYESINGNVGGITETLNNYLGGAYTYNIFYSVDDYENAVYNALAQGSPVIARVKFDEEYFNYSTPGHYTTICSIHRDSIGTPWVKVVDSYVDRYTGNWYTDAETGIVDVPLEDLFDYGTYNGESPVYLIYNP